MSADVTPLGHLPRFGFDDRIRRVRRDMGIDQGKMAELLGIDRQTYSAWESGRNKPRSVVAIAEKLEEISGVPRQWFLGWMDDQPPSGGGPESGRRDSNPQHSAWKAETLAN